MYTGRYATEGVIRVIVGNKTDLPGRVVERKMVQWFVEEVRPLSLHGHAQCMNSSSKFAAPAGPGYGLRPSLAGTAPPDSDSRGRTAGLR